MTTRILAALLAALSIAACSQPAPDTGAVLTITGAIETTNRGGKDATEDALLNWLGADFDRAHSVTAADLASLNPITVTADYPAGGDAQTFTGPRLADVLALAGPTGDTLTATALDGYGAEIPLALIDSYDVILATQKNGEPLSLGGFGPAQIVFPRSDEPVFEGMDDSLWVWGVVWMRVE